MQTQPPRPATPRQIQLLVGLSCLPVLPMAAWAMWYVTGLLPAAARASAWQAFGLALVCGAGYGLALTRLIPVFGGQLPGSSTLRRMLSVFLILALPIFVAAGQALHQPLPVLTGAVFGTDTLLASVLLARSLPQLGDISVPRR